MRTMETQKMYIAGNIAARMAARGGSNADTYRASFRDVCLGWNAFTQRRHLSADKGHLQWCGYVAARMHLNILNDYAAGQCDDNIDHKENYYE